MDRMGKAEKCSETIWCEGPGDNGLPAQAVEDADGFLATNRALSKGQKKAT